MQRGDVGKISAVQLATLDTVAQLLDIAGMAQTTASLRIATLNTALDATQTRFLLEEVLATRLVLSLETKNTEVQESTAASRRETLPSPTMMALTSTPTIY